MTSIQHLASGTVPVYGTGGYMLSVDDKLSDINAIGIGRKGTINKPQYLIAPFWTVDTLFFLTSRKNYDLKLLFYISEKIRWNKYDESTGVPSLSKNTINSIPITVPSKVSEQKIIGKVFTKIDNLIAANEEKVSQLKVLKKLLMQKIFSQEWRFKGFTDPWEQHKLIEVAKVTMGQSPNSKNYTDNPKDTILVQGNADMKDGYVVPRVWTKEITGMAQAGDIILSVRAPVGDVGKTMFNIVLGRGVAGIKGNEFIYQYLNNLKAVDYWRRVSTGSTFESINSDDIKNLPLNIPEKDEENNIGMILSRVDNLIAANEEKLAQLKEVKKYLMQNMFI